jgi:hypothetical protein
MNDQARQAGRQAGRQAEAAAGRGSIDRSERGGGREKVVLSSSYTFSLR